MGVNIWMLLGINFLWISDEATLTKLDLQKTHRILKRSIYLMERPRCLLLRLADLAIFLVRKTAIALGILSCALLGAVRWLVGVFCWVLN